MIIGIDPGSNTGVAYFSSGKLATLQTVHPWQIPDVIRHSLAKRVIFEDSRLQSTMWTTVKSRPAALKMARNVGEIDAWCKLIVAVCESLGIPAHGISPRSKGAKLSAATFTSATGWTARCNEHERDAAMVAYPYRNAK